MRVTARRGSFFLLLALGGLAAGCLQRELAPQNPCLASGVKTSVDSKGIHKVDLLFMVDNSLSMVQEQAKLREQFPKLIKTLTTGIRADGTTFSPVTDLHIAVVTSDMGTPGMTTVPTCSEFGSDGVFKHDSNPSQDKTLQGCDPTYPPFLEFHGGQSDPTKTANDFACIATVGSGGCGYEQQLEAPLKALWPRVLSDAHGSVVAPGFNFLGGTTTNGAFTFGHGDGENAGFLRNDPNDPSLLAIVLVTDEDDCSSSTTVQFGDDPQFSSEPPNLRCHDNPNNLWPISRYVDNFKKLRPGHPELVLYAAIAGIPENLVADGKNVNFEVAAARDAFYDHMLNDPNMIETPVRSMGDPYPEPDNLQTACVSKHGDTAFPARRLVEVAKGMGAQATVQSICAESFEPAMDAIIELITDRLKGVCLARPLVRDKTGVVKCEVVWELPPASAPVDGAPRDCTELPYLAAPEAGHPQISLEGKKLCVMQQLPVQNHSVLPGAQTEGWYYDDFSPDVIKGCKRYPTPQRVSFTAHAIPPFGVTVSLQCFDEAQRSVSNRNDVDPTRAHAEIGDSCEELKNGAQSQDEMCWVKLIDPRGGAQNDGTDRSMFCHPTRNVCVRSCNTRSDCPAAWVCDARPDTLMSTASTVRNAADHSREAGSAICVNPTCAADDGS